MACSSLRRRQTTSSRAYCCWRHVRHLWLLLCCRCCCGDLLPLRCDWRDCRLRICFVRMLRCWSALGGACWHVKRWRVADGTEVRACGQFAKWSFWQSATTKQAGTAEISAWQSHQSSEKPQTCSIHASAAVCTTWSTMCSCWSDRARAKYSTQASCGQTSLTCSRWCASAEPPTAATQTGLVLDTGKPETPALPG